MLRTGSRQLLRQSVLPRAAGPRMGAVRYQSTRVPRRSFKNGLARWAIAIGGTYWYMTSPIFNDKPAYVVQGSSDSSDSLQAKLQSIDSVKPSSKFTPPHPEDAPIVPSTPTSSSPPSINPKADDPGSSEASEETAEIDADAAAALEQEATSQGAFNEKTGEINWDCPCLGGMAYGPCGEQFRDAFSCFVFSKDEPKGIDCIDRFERMQTCFRAHPEIYADEIADDERIAAEVQAEGEGNQIAAAPTASSTGGPDVDQPSVWTPLVNEEAEGKKAASDSKGAAQA